MQNRSTGLWIGTGQILIEGALGQPRFICAAFLGRESRCPRDGWSCRCSWSPVLAIKRCVHVPRSLGERTRRGEAMLERVQESNQVREKVLIKRQDAPEKRQRRQSVCAEIATTLLLVHLPRNCLCQVTLLNSSLDESRGRVPCLHTGK